MENQSNVHSTISYRFNIGVFKLRKTLEQIRMWSRLTKDTAYIDFVSLEAFKSFTMKYLVCSIHFN